MPSVEKKKCCMCKAVLPATNEFFYRDNHRADGLQGSCKVCIRDYNKKRNDDIRIREKKAGKPRRTDKTYPSEEQTITDRALGQVDRILRQAGARTALEAAAAVKHIVPTSGRIELKVLEMALEQMAGRAARKGEI